MFSITYIDQPEQILPGKCDNAVFSRENQEILQDMSQLKTIEPQSVNDDELLQMETLVNKDDQELRSAFIASGLLDGADGSEADDNVQIPEGKPLEDDYDVDDLLNDVLPC
jgi:hypothetical protein